MRALFTLFLLFFACTIYAVDVQISDEMSISSDTPTELLEVGSMDSHSTDEEEEKCAICWRELERPFEAFECIHTNFHASCVTTYRDTALHNSFACPMCRAKPLSMHTERDAIYMPKSASRRAIKSIYANDFEAFFEEVQGFKLTDAQKVRFVTTSLRHLDTRKIFDEIIFLLTGNIHYYAIEDWTPMTKLFTEKVNTPMDREIVASLIKLASLSPAHLAAHEACVTRRDWRCASEFIEYYDDATDSEFGTRLGPVFLSTVLGGASVSHIEDLLDASFDGIPDPQMKKAVRFMLRGRQWKKLKVIIAYLVKHPSGQESYESTFRYFRNSTRVLPSSVELALDSMLERYLV